MPTGKETQPASDRQTRSQTLRQRRVKTVVTDPGDEMVPRVRQETMSPGVAEEKEEILLHEVKSDGMSGADERTNGLQPSNGRLLMDGVNRTDDKTSNRLEDDSEDEIVEETSLSQPLLPVERSREDELDKEIIVVPKESSLMIAAQVFLPFLIAGFGTVGAGLVLDVVQHWKVYKVVTEVFILVPALLGLKGNLEMTLASRLSTQANLGNMEVKSEQWKMIAGNMALTQCQAIVVGFLASLAAVIFGWIPDGEFDIQHVLLLCASSLVTASLASGLLGSIMIVVILFSKKCNINPDNVATPIAASLGDLITLALLSWISNLLFEAMGKQHWLAPSIIIGFLLISPLWAYLSHHNKYTHDVLYSGWTPVIVAMMISSVGGLVLDIAIRQNEGVAVFSPVINGVGGNLVAVQSSRLSTSLHQHCPPGALPSDRKGTCKNPLRVFFAKDQHSKSARVLFMMVVPGQLIFLYFISYVKAGHTSITLRVTFMYLIVAMIQVGFLLAIADWLVHLLWKQKKDPDNFSIPYLTAVGDLLGTTLLAIGFYIVWSLGDRDSDVGD